VYWFLICSGYKTYRFLPVFFQEFYPSYRSPMPVFEQCVLGTFGRLKFGAQYRDGIIRFDHPTPLRPGIAEISKGRLGNPDVAFYVQSNPGHAQGDELACLCPLELTNLTRAGRRAVAGDALDCQRVVVCLVPAGGGGVSPRYPRRGRHATAPVAPVTGLSRRCGVSKNAYRCRTSRASPANR